jgi:hypothetical protein
MLGLSLNFGIWIRDDRWPPGCGTPDNDNAKIQSSLLARNSSKSKKESMNGVRRRGVPKKRIYFQLIVFKDFIVSCFFLLTKRI